MSSRSLNDPNAILRVRNISPPDPLFPLPASSSSITYHHKSFPSTSSIKFPPDTDSNPFQRTKEGASPSSLVKNEVNRCSGCRRKVGLTGFRCRCGELFCVDHRYSRKASPGLGLTGFRCRCGELFCVDHRYSDRHDCSYDYKTIGREAISRENPVVKASKIFKI